MLAGVSPNNLTGEPPCPPAVGDTASPAAGSDALRAVRRAFDAVDPAAWDALVDANPWATPFSRWAFHRAWWDGYGANAHEETLVARPGGRARRRPARGDRPADAPPRGGARRRRAAHDDPPRGRPGPDPGPAGREGGLLRRLVPRRLRDAAGRARRPARGRRRAGRVLRAGGRPGAPAAVGRRGPAPPALRRPGRRRPGRRLRRPRDRRGWTLNVEREDVCPVATLPAGGSIDDYLATLGKKERHEIRRKVRRAEAAGEVRLDDSADPLADLPAFIDLHQKRWGADGLFPDTPGGEQSRVFFRAPVRAVRRRRPAEAGVPHRRRAPDRGRGLVRDPGRAPLLQRRRGPRARATCRRAWSWWSATCGAPWSAGSREWTSCAATSPTSTSGARWTSQSSGCSSDEREGR